MMMVGGWEYQQQNCYELSPIATTRACGSFRKFVFAAMGKSIRSKRLKRLRTLKRELVAPHYDAKELAKLAAQEAAAQAPKIELPKRRSDSESMGKYLLLSFTKQVCFKF